MNLLFKFSIVVFALFLNVYCFSQDTRDLTNYHKSFTFFSSYTYDNDLEQATSPVVQIESIVLLDIDEKSEGRVILYFNNEKIKFDVLGAFEYSLTDKSRIYSFDILNYRKVRQRARLYIDRRNYVTQFELLNKENNISTFFGY